MSITFFFDVPAKQLLPDHKSALEKRIANRISSLIKVLEQQVQTHTMATRIQHVQDVLTRLSNS